MTGHRDQNPEDDMPEDEVPEDVGDDIVDSDSEAELDDGINLQIAEALRAALAPGDDVRSRARVEVDRTLQGRSLTSVLTDIAGIGPATIWHLLTNAPEMADRRSPFPDDRSRRMAEPGIPKRYDEPTPEPDHD